MPGHLGQLCRYTELALTIMQALLGTAGSMLRSEDPTAMKVHTPVA